MKKHHRNTQARAHTHTHKGTLTTVPVSPQLICMHELNVYNNEAMNMKERKNCFPLIKFEMGYPNKNSYPLKGKSSP